VTKMVQAPAASQGNSKSGQKAGVEWELHESNHIDSHGKGMEGERMPRNLTECVVDSVTTSTRTMMFDSFGTLQILHGSPEREIEREESELDCSVCFQVPCCPR